MPCKKLFLSSIILFVLFSFSLISSVGASSVMWSQTYGGAGQEVAHWLVGTSDGGYALAGYTRDFGAPEGDGDFWLVKTDANGNMEWNQTYGGVLNDYARALIETKNGGYVIAGGLWNFWLVKTDAYGNMEWNQTYGGAGTDRAYSVVETSDGGYALAGSTWSFGAGKDDFWLVKTDRYGNLEWNRTYGGARSDSASSFVVTSDGGFALAGDTFLINSSDPDFLLIKTDDRGNMEWNQTYDSWWDHASSVVETSDGGYVIAGFAGSYFGIGDFWLVKTDGNGNMEWDKKHDQSLNSLVETSDGGFALAGVTESFDHGFHNDFWLVKTDSYGNIEWSQTHGGLEDDIAHSLVETSDGGYAIAGYTYSFGAGDSDFWLVKTDEHGIIPEFPSWTILPLLLTATLVIIIWKQRLPKHQTNKTILGD